MIQRSIVILAATILAAALVTPTLAEDIVKQAVWITGDVFTDNKVLLFRTDKPVTGNTAGNIVLLGASKETMNTFLPVYMKAAEKHMKLRLYGVLVPANVAASPQSQAKPSVQFITWKINMPNEPDELPDREIVPVGPKDAAPGYTVKPNDR